MTEYYVVLRLVSGDELMAVLESEDEHYIQLLNPISVRTIPLVAEGKEHVLTTPFCQFTKDPTFILDKKHVLFVKQLANAMIPHYLQVVENYSHAENFRPATDFEDQDSMTPEEARKRIAMLAAIFGDELDDEMEEETPKSTFIGGNDTKH
jgi:hypothetical protein